ncbi:MAG: hypothetical protein U9Q69_02005 [Nanoarchaeota archaeon]|nr:hypothetical protein [Nanoarchaeota archaeon]
MFKKKKVLTKITSKKKSQEKNVLNLENKVKNLKERYEKAKNRLDYVLEGIGKFRIEMDELIKKNFDYKKRINELKALKSKIPKEIKYLERKINGNFKIIQNIKKNIRGYSKKKNLLMGLVKKLNHIMRKHEMNLLQFKSTITELAKKEKKLIKKDFKKTTETAKKNIIGFVKSYVLPEEKPKKTAKKKTSKKNTKKKAVKKKTSKKKK